MNRLTLGVILVVGITLSPFRSLAAPPTPSCKPSEVLSSKDCRSNECRVACLWANYDGGFYRDGQCYCVDKKQYEVMTGEKKLRLPKPQSN